jgi:hypothetical protein
MYIEMLKQFPDELGQYSDLLELEPIAAQAQNPFQVLDSQGS